MSDVRDAYLACWNETDAAARRTLIERHWAADATYVDPMTTAQGLDGVDATIAAVQQQFPGMVFTPSGPVDGHHNLARFGWGLGPDGAEPLVLGFDVVASDEQGRIASVHGFLDKVPG